MHRQFRNQSDQTQNLQLKFNNEQKRMNNESNVKNNESKNSNRKKNFLLKNSFKGGNADSLSQESLSVTPCSEKIDLQKPILVLSNEICPSVTKTLELEKQNDASQKPTLEVRDESGCLGLRDSVHNEMEFQLNSPAMDKMLNYKNAAKNAKNDEFYEKIKKFNEDIAAANSANELLGLSLNKENTQIAKKLLSKNYSDVAQNENSLLENDELLTYGKQNSKNDETKMLDYLKNTDLLEGEVVFNLNRYDEKLIENYQTVELEIDKITCKFIVDTGADVSCLSEEIIRKTNKEINFKNVIKIQGVTNNILFTIGSCNLSFFNGLLNHEFHILPSSYSQKFNGILGRDFFSKNKVIITYEENLLKFPNIGLSLPLKPDYKKTFYDIPKRTQKYITAQCNAIFKDGIVESRQLQDNLFLSNCVTNVQNGKCIVCVINISEDDLRIPEPKVILEPLRDFEMLEKMEINLHDENRVEKLLNRLNFEHLNLEEKASIQNLCAKFSDVFHLEDDEFTCTNATNHKISIKADQIPLHTKPYRLPYFHREEIKVQTEKMLQDGVIRPSHSAWNSPLLVVPKKKDKFGKTKWRVVVDFRNLNEVTVGDAFPLPNITEILDQLGGSKYFSVMDLNCGFHQLELDEESKKLTAFSTPYGHFEYTRMPFGLRNAPATFQRLMNAVLSGLQGTSCFIYMDDTVIYGNNLEEHNRKLERVLERFRKFNLKLQPDKCEFLRKEVAYLGHILTENGIRPNPDKIECVKSFPVPTNVTKLKSFLGLVNYYRKFIENLSKIALPLTKLTSKKSKYEWTMKCQEAFDLTTDASGLAIGSVLSQGELGSDLPIAFASRQLTPAELNYDTAEKEMLAIVWSVRHFRPYLYGMDFKIYTDHRNLQWLFDKTDPSSRLVRWRIDLSEIKHKIIYKPGKINTNADALSRIFSLTKAGTYGDFQNSSESPIINLHIEEYKRDILEAPLEETMVVFISHDLQMHDPYQDSVEEKYKLLENISKLTQPLNKIFEFESGNRKIVCFFDKENYNQKSSSDTYYGNFKELSIYLSQNDHRFIALPILGANDNVNWIQLRLMLRYIFKNTNIEISIYKPPKKIISQDIQAKILEEFHNLPIGGHQGYSRTYKRIRLYYNWAGMKKQLKEFIKTCYECQINKLKRATRMPMEIVSSSSKPFEKVYLDIVGPLTLTENGNKYILTFMDDLSKFLRAIPIPNQEANTVAKAFVENIICLHGVPEVVLTDQGTNFIGSVFKSVCKLFNIKKIQTTSYHPQANGALERSHRTMAEHLRSLVNQSQTDWDEWIPQVVFTFNTTVHSSTGFTPFELLYGYVATLPSSITDPPKPLYNYDDFAIDQKNKFQHCRKRARENIMASKAQSKKYYDKKLKSRSFQVGDLVLLKREQLKPGLCSKLSPLRLGPYEIVEVHSPLNYSIKIGKKTCRVNTNRLQPYFRRK
jgi:hypothetical protein